MRKIIIVFMTVLGLVHGAPGKEIVLTPHQAIVAAGDMVRRGDAEHARQILTKLPDTGVAPLEVERRFLMGQIYQGEGDFDAAIKIYQSLLDMEPGLARVRFELAVCYMRQKKWRRADYHLRLAMAGRDLPDEAKRMMNYYRYLIRQNKNWNVWFNLGAAPDNNVNNSVGGRECVMTMFGLMCRDLEKPESAIGANFSIGGDYEFKLSENWRWKSAANFYSNIYDRHDYDDLYLMLSSGPRYVWSRGDVWVAPMWSRRWYAGARYNRSAGVRVDTNYDFTRRLSGGLYMRMTENKYDEYNDLLNGESYSATIRLLYSLNARVYFVGRAGLMREDAHSNAYSYWSPNLSIGVGAELPWGFHVYAEPGLYWNWYDGGRWVVRHNHISSVTERDFTRRYALSVSNNKLDIWGFVPTITVSYTRRDSNIWQREFDKTAIEFTMQQRF